MSYQSDQANQVNSKSNLSDLSYLLALYRLPGMGPITMRRFLERYTDLPLLFKTPGSVLCKQDIDKGWAVKLRAPDWQGVEKI